MTYKTRHDGWYFNPQRTTQRWNGVGTQPLWFKKMLEKSLDPNDYFLPDTAESKKQKEEMIKLFDEIPNAQKRYC